jgi:predicted nucleotidyltransferase
VVAETGRRFAAARQVWLRDAQAILEADRRVAAVLITGSLGRGTSDQWSDVDLSVILAPATAARVIADRETFVHSLGECLLVYDSPWNAPDDGAQTNVLYDVGCRWPLYVDWDLWPLSRAAVSPDVAVMFDRVGVPGTSELLDDHRSWSRAPRPRATPERVRAACVAMLPIIAKCIVRGDNDRATRMLTNLGYEPSRDAKPESLIGRVDDMWREVRTEASDPLVRAISSMLDIAARAIDAAPVQSNTAVRRP